MIYPQTLEINYFLWEKWCQLYKVNSILQFVAFAGWYCCSLYVILGSYWPLSLNENSSRKSNDLLIFDFQLCHSFELYLSSPLQHNWKGEYQISEEILWSWINYSTTFRSWYQWHFHQELYSFPAAIASMWESRDPWATPSGKITEYMC